ncbi:START domain-containing protein [Pedobacter sp. SL55]|uniref:START domain-containing protein n=1 Tax=Pedobacter sp. SL55 TaxID=2995161 RepID=UPI0022704222|nr:START domain-containing protein [Pedobacter sp. SL55]WAC41028.1 START domain-containing protein [Pedobacter sp. SL55]
MYKKYLLCLMLFFLYKASYGQADWTLKSAKSGLNIYTKTVSSSGLKGIRVKCTLPAKLSQIVALIMDVNTGEEWVYGTKSSFLLKKVSPSELYYYSEVDIPWPISNRDFIAHLTVSQDPQTKVVTINGPTEANYLPVKPSIVRVSHSVGKWVLTPTKNNLVQIDYTLEVDPGGTIPVWLVNLFATSGPAETFKKMKEQVKKAQYVNANLSFIDNG